MKRLIPLFLLLPLQTFAHGGGEAMIEVGADKGVLEVSKDRAFRLAPEAIKRLGIANIPITDSTMTVPSSAVAHSLRESNIFRIRGEWIKGVSFKTVSKTEGKLTLHSKEIQKGDSLVTSGVGFLRMIALQLGTEEAEDEHSEAGHSDAEHSEEGHHD